MSADFNLLGQSTQQSTKMVGFLSSPTVNNENSQLNAGVPLWLERLLSSKFFEPCPRHENERKNDINMFCMNCSDSICQHCLGSSHLLHKILQVRRYVYHDVVLLHDIQKLIDCSGVQSYKINRAKAVFLNPRPQLKSAAVVKPGNGAVCESCDRGLMSESSSYCSIACKVTNGALMIKSLNFALLGLPEVISINADADSPPPPSPTSSHCNSSEESGLWLTCLKPKKQLNKRKGIPRKAPIF